MSKKDEALKMALDALETLAKLTGARWALENSYAGHLEAITAINQALAEPPCKTGSQCTSKCQQCEQPAQQQEPVAVYVGETWCGSVVRLYEDLPLETPLYTSPPASKPLTDERIKAIYAEQTGFDLDSSPEALMDFARAIEAAHGIKGDA